MARRPDDVSAALARAGAEYRPFLPFTEWMPGGVDLSVWDDALATLDERRNSAPSEVVEHALQERLRAAAVDTGAIEGLYATDRGFTLSVAQQTISMDQAEVEKGGDFRANFEAQLDGFELALDAATSATPISEAFIRRLHEVTCAGQQFYRVLRSVGVQERRLAPGSYKTDPNHVQLGDGTFHAYAPVGQVADEMHRLVEQVRSPAFASAHPVVQAAYVHHAFTWIHPFPDGNGRVARLLASIWLLRGASIPLWIETTDRERYLDALSAADSGEAATFIELIGDVSLRLLRELGVAIGYPAQVVQRTEAELRDRARLAVLNRLDQMVDESIQMQFDTASGVTGDLPSELVGEQLLLLGLSHPSETARVAAVLSARGGAQGAFRVVGLSTGPTHTVDIDEPFSLDEFVPEISAPADRRLQAIAEIMMRKLDEEQDPRSTPWRT